MRAWRQGRAAQKDGTPYKYFIMFMLHGKVSLSLGILDSCYGRFLILVDSFNSTKSFNTVECVQAEFKVDITTLLP
jgi:hypothetical protein